MIQSCDSTDGNIDKPFDVAVKRLIQGDNSTDVEKFYRRETIMLKVMNKLNHKHLIKAIATYTKGNDKYFLFPWANGGNLQDMMKTDRRELDKELIHWVLHQIFGLSDGMRALHRRKI
jgi:serine/threonine protein kinase